MYKSNLGASAVVQWVKLPPETPASHLEASQNPSCFTLIQLIRSKQWKMTQVLGACTHIADKKLPASGPAQIQLATVVI